MSISFNPARNFETSQKFFNMRNVLFCFIVSFSNFKNELLPIFAIFKSTIYKKDRFILITLYFDLCLEPLLREYVVLVHHKSTL